MTEVVNAVVLERTLTQEDFDRFAALSGDDNPIHVSPDFSARTRFGRTVSHGVLLLTILRGLAAQLAPGARQLTQEAMYPAPTFAGEPMRFSAEIVARKPEGVEIAMRAVRMGDGVVTCDCVGLFG
jgi:acyl dehydratase